IMQIGIEGADAAIVAIDGHAVTPFALATWPMGPAMRADLVIRTPREGGVVRLVDRSEQPRVELARFVATGASLRKTEFDPAPLPASAIPQPDLNTAPRLSFTLDMTSAGKAVADMATAERIPVAATAFPGVDFGALCLSRASFWTVNGRTWPEASADELKSGA